MKLKLPAESYLMHRGEGHIEYYFMCPGCRFDHRVIVRWGNNSGKTEPIWGFNDNLDKPTFRPSLIVQWETPKGKNVCHSFITDGEIQFLIDSTHALAGKTVPLEDV